MFLIKFLLQVKNNKLQAIFSKEILTYKLKNGIKRNKLIFKKQQTKRKIYQKIKNRSQEIKKLYLVILNI